MYVTVRVYYAAIGTDERRFIGTKVKEEIYCGNCNTVVNYDEHTINKP